MAAILAVDDQKVMRDLVNAVLAAEGHQVTTAEDGVEALALAREHSFDLVLSDINMPNMNGISLVSKLRRLDHFEGVPIIMLTTESGDFKKDKAKKLGANGWLLKPFEPERLVNAVNVTLQKAGKA
ncbi:MAG: response regulator [Chromatiales bacterium]|jgi:two-component system chemotaxis response regulator CheY